MTRMTRKVLNVMEEKWDYLIILDACRYDYFESLHKDFFGGELEKRISLGSNTIEWCLESFKGYYLDVIYPEKFNIVLSRDSCFKTSFRITHFNRTANRSLNLPTTLLGFPFSSQA